MFSLFFMFVYFCSVSKFLPLLYLNFSKIYSMIFGKPKNWNFCFLINKNNCLLKNFKLLSKYLSIISVKRMININSWFPGTLQSLIYKVTFLTDNFRFKLKVMVFLMQIWSNWSKNLTAVPMLYPGVFEDAKMLVQKTLKRALQPCFNVPLKVMESYKMCFQGLKWCNTVLLISLVLLTIVYNISVYFFNSRVHFLQISIDLNGGDVFIMNFFLIL
jgi:hypothetical protein